MKKLHKIVLFIVSLIGLLCSVAMLSMFYYIPAVTDAVTLAYALFPFLHEMFAVYILLVALCFFLLMAAALLAPKSSGYLILMKDGGRLQFSRQTVESTVRYSFADVEGVNLSAVKAALGRTPEKTRIFIKLSLNDPNRLVELTEAVKNKIEAALQASLGVTAKSINIKVVELAQGKEPQDKGPQGDAPAPVKEEEPTANSRVI